MPSKEISIFDIQEFSLGKKFGILGRLYLAALSKRLKHLGIEKHFSVMVIIHEMGDNCCQKNIAKALDIDKTIMVGVLDDLTKKGFIKRVQNPKDRREYWIHLTPKGKKSVPEILAKVKSLNKSLVKDSDQMTELNEHLKSIYETLVNDK